MSSKITYHSSYHGVGEGRNVAINGNHAKKIKYEITKRRLNVRRHREATRPAFSMMGTPVIIC